MIYVLDILEFQVLAAACGMETYYGVPVIEEYQNQDLYMAVHQMVKDGLLKKEEDRLTVQPPIADYLKSIMRSRNMMIFTNAAGFCTRRCLYPSETGVICIENSSTDTDKLFLYHIPLGELQGELEDARLLPEKKLPEDIGDYDFKAYWDQHLQTELWELLAQGWSTASETLLESENVYEVVSVNDRVSGEPMLRLILIDLPLEYLVVKQTAKSSLQMEQYNKEVLLDTIENWWRKDDDIS